MTYEYDVQKFDVDKDLIIKKVLNQLGAQGWKVVGVGPHFGSVMVTVILMRERETENVR